MRVVEWRNGVIEAIAVPSGHRRLSAGPSKSRLLSRVALRAQSRDDLSTTGDCMSQGLG